MQTTRGSTDTYDAYEYDARNRLTASCYGIVASATNCSGAANAITYAYDKVSNRTQEVRTGSVGNTGTIDSTYNTADQLTSTSQGGSTTNYTYDANGNQATAGARSFTYDLADQQLTSTSGGTTTTYGYDGDGQRTSSATSGGSDLRHTWDPRAESGIPELALERTSTGGLVRRYTGGPLGATSFTDTSGTFSYHRDQLGSVTDITDASGAAQWKYEYEAYGAERSAINVSGSAPVNRLGFNGQVADSESTLYHLRARQYDPATGRFDALDPIANPVNAPYNSAYGYVNGRPTVLIDPLGLYGRGDLTDDLIGVGRMIIDTERAILPIVVPGMAGKAVADRIRNGVNTYHEYGGGPHAALDVFNDQLNPVYALMANSYMCRNPQESGDRGYYCSAAMRDALLLLVPEYAACRSVGGLSRLGSRLANESGELRFGRPTPLTNAQVRDLARWLGFEETGERLNGQIVFRRGRTFIVQDITSHNGGTWKMASSIERLRRKSTRTGTYDEQLIVRVGD